MPKEKLEAQKKEVTDRAANTGIPGEAEDVEEVEEEEEEDEKPP